MRAAARIRTEDLVVTWGINESAESMYNMPCQLDKKYTVHLV